MPPAAVGLAVEHADRVAAYQATMRATGHKTGRSTMQAARSFSAKVERAGGWARMSRARQVDAIGKARSFASWMMVTGQLSIDADVLGRVYLRLGTSARAFRPEGVSSSSSAVVHAVSCGAGLISPNQQGPGPQSRPRG